MNNWITEIDKTIKMSYSCYPISGCIKDGLNISGIKAFLVLHGTIEEMKK